MSPNIMSLGYTLQFVAHVKSHHAENNLSYYDQTTASNSA